MLSGFSFRARMLLLPFIELLAPLGPEFSFWGSRLRFRFGTATPLAVGLLSFDGLVPGPASVLFFCHSSRAPHVRQLRRDRISDGAKLDLQTVSEIQTG